MSYSVSIKVKPYIKKYLESKYGSPVRFPDQHNGSYYQNLLSRMLSKPSTKFDNHRAGLEYAKNNNLVDMRISISAYLFYNYGWELTITDQMAFNGFVESIVKEHLYICVSANSQVCTKINDGVKLFRNITGITEDDYSSEAIKKHLYRLGIRKKSFFYNVQNILSHDKQHLTLVTN